MITAPIGSLMREEFSTYEAEVARVQEYSGLKIPNTLNGAKAFLSGLSAWISQGDDRTLDQTAVVLPDPSQNLSLPYPSDELALAISSSKRGAATDEEVRALADAFALAPELLERQTTALSGGERMLVSLAKASALTGCSHRLCLCSPYFWLDGENRKLVVDRFKHSPVSDSRLILLEGEDDTQPGEIKAAEAVIKPISWHLQMDSVSVTFPAQTFPRPTTEKSMQFLCNSRSIAFNSPTLITGRNGVGKTTLAKLLTGLVEPDVGSVQVVTGGLGGTARLMLQDTPLHLFGNSVGEHLGRVFRFDKELWKEARKLYAALQKDCLRRASSTLPGVMLADGNSGQSILQSKLAVAVERLFGATPLLILDEPGWCLSRSVGRAFVQAVTNAAHERGIAVALISHQSKWWSDIVQDEVHLQPLDPYRIEVTKVDKGGTIQ